MVRDTASGRDRAQLLLVGAFAIAVLVLSLALVLNGAAQTETLATESTDVHDGRDAVRFEHSVRRGVGGTVESVNRRNNTSYADLKDALKTAVNDWDAVAARGSAGEGVSTSVNYRSMERGSRIEQTTTRDFSDATGTENWTLASSVTQTRDYRMNVSRTSLSSDCSSGCFEIVADDGSDTWRASFTEDGSEIEMTVVAPSGTDTCRVAADSAVVNLSAGTMDDGACSFPGFADGLSGPYSISYENGSLGEGTYEQEVDTSVTNDTRYAAGGPTVSPSIYSTNVSVTYETPQLMYNTTALRVVPGESDD
ncbi:hypothetical protein C439_18268 [Haloferax mediterranei ATCC 33500]|nr:hypothetical protein C439_18268 [Haloferax mediterranei ATCC 33500]